MVTFVCVFVTDNCERTEKRRKRNRRIEKRTEVEQKDGKRKVAY